MTAQTAARLFVTTNPLTDDDATGQGALHTVDLDASNDRYDEKLTEALKAYFPEYDIEVEFRHVYTTKIVLDGDDEASEDDILAQVNGVIGNVYQDGSAFWVEVADTTESGAFRVFHNSEAGSPESFEDPGFYFEPNNSHGGDDVYSAAYETKAEALAAAETWEVESAREEAE